MISYVVGCSGCCSGGSNCNWTSGCIGWPNEYTMTTSGFGPERMFGTIWDSTWTLIRPAVLNSAICSWGNQGPEEYPSCTSFSSGSQWIMRFDEVSTNPPQYLNSGNALNCDNTLVLFPSYGGGLYYGVLFLIFQCFSNPQICCYYVTSGYITSGAWNCSGPTTLFQGPNIAYNGQGVAGPGASGVPIEITVTPLFI